jgi:hypothetical protein
MIVGKRTCSNEWQKSSSKNGLSLRAAENWRIISYRVNVAQIESEKTRDNSAKMIRHDASPCLGTSLSFVSISRINRINTQPKCRSTTRNYRKNV